MKRILLIVLVFVMSAMTPLQISAKKVAESEGNLFYTFPNGSVINSLLADIRTEGIQAVFVDMHAMAGSLCNRYIQGDRDVPSSSIEFCAYGACHKIEDVAAFKAFIEGLKAYNDTCRAKVKLYGIDCSTSPSSWCPELNRVPEYKATTLPDSLERYCLDEDINIYQQAKRTAKMMERERKRFGLLLGEDYPIWLRYIKALSKKSATLSYRFDAERVDKLLADDYRWLNKRVPGRKVVVCSPNFKSVIEPGH